MIGALAGEGISVLGVTLSDYGPEALCAVFILLVFLGVWVPRRERDQWRAQALKSADQVDRLIESVEPMVKFIKELKEQTRETPKQGGDPS